MTAQFERLGPRCSAMDGMGNRCIKDVSHTSSPHGSEEQHDASRGALLRHWR